MTQDDRTFYLMMFCGLLLVKKSRASVKELLPILPHSNADGFLALQISMAAAGDRG